MSGYAYDISRASAKEQRLRRIAAAVEAGMTWREVALEFGISTKTVGQAVAYLTGKTPRPRMLLDAD